MPDGVESRERVDLLITWILEHPDAVYDASQQPVEEETDQEMAVNELLTILGEVKQQGAMIVTSDMSVLCRDILMTHLRRPLLIMLQTCWMDLTSLTRVCVCVCVCVCVHS